MTTGPEDVGTAEDLHAWASRVTGLTDFGEDPYLDGLEVLLDSYAREAALTPQGARAARAMLHGALASRLRAQAAWRRHPEHAGVRIERPVFVTGLPRTGTTALHRLLTADPANQGLEVWLTEAPRPRPPRETWADDPAFRAAQAAYERHHVRHPEFMGVHYMSAGMVEECWRVLQQSMRSVSFECLAHLPSYSAWLTGQDWRPAYLRHRDMLRLIGLHDAGRRWVLKNPSHLFALDALMEVYPDALVIQTHRAPATAMASMCSLAAHATAGWSRAFTGQAIGRDQLELWSRGLGRFRAERARHDPARFFDVHYEEFVRDPLGTVDAVYAHFGLPLGDAARTAMARLFDDSRTGESRPAHTYTLSDFGLSAEEVDERFAGHPAGR